SEALDRAAVRGSDAFPQPHTKPRKSAGRARTRRGYVTLADVRRPIAAFAFACAAAGCSLFLDTSGFDQGQAAPSGDGGTGEGGSGNVPPTTPPTAQDGSVSDDGGDGGPITRGCIAAKATATRLLCEEFETASFPANWTQGLSKDGKLDISGAA